MSRQIYTPSRAVVHLTMPVSPLSLHLTPLTLPDDDWAASIVASAVGADHDSAQLLERARSYINIWNAGTGFMEARTSSGDWAGEETGWTEGDHWAYSLNVMVLR